MRRVRPLPYTRWPLRIYAELRGLAPRTIEAHCVRLLAEVGLSAVADQRCGTYSGGTKRKLTLAISLVGAPGLLLLDEPSCGLDPVSRRQIWDVILALRPTRSIVLTSHAMEECEALCTRVGVMVLGHGSHGARARHCIPHSALTASRAL